MSVRGGGRKNRSSLKVLRSDERGPAARLIDRALKSLAESLGADTSSIVLADRQSGSLVVHAAHGLSEGARQSPKRLGEGVASYVLSQSGPVLLRNPRTDRRLRRVCVTPRTDISSSICIPLSFNRSTMGVLSLSRKTGAPPFREQDVRFAASMAARLRPAVESAIKDGARPVLSGHSSRQHNLLSASQDNLRRQLREATVLYEAVRRLNASVSLPQVLRELRRAARRILGNPRVEHKFVLFGRPQDHARIPGVARLKGNGHGSTLLSCRRLTRPVWAGENGTWRAVADTMSGGEGPVLLLPLRDGRSSLGLAAISGLSRRTSQEKMAALAALHAHGAAAARRAMAYGRTSKSQSLGVSAVQDLCLRMSEAATLREALACLLKVAASAARCDSAILLLRDEASGRLETAAVRGRRREPGDWERGVYEWVVSQKRAFLADAVAGYGCLMAVPLVAENRGLGVVALRGKAGAFSQEQVKTLSILCCQAAAGYRALQSLGRMSQYAENLLTSLVAGVIGLDQGGRVIIWSPAAEEVLACPAALAVGQPLEQVMEEAARRKGCPAVSMITQIGLQALRDSAGASSRELACEGSGGRVTYLNVSSSPVQTPGGERIGAVLLVEDATERKRLEHHMQQVQQLAALGHMAAKVAHEVRNPLSAIKAAAQLLAEDSTDNGLVGELSHIIDEECDRLRKLTSDFLAYAKPAIPRADQIRVQDVVRRCLRLMEPDLKTKGIAVARRCSRSALKVEADAEQLEQVFMNLITNAAQAMDGGGRIVVSARPVERGGRAMVEVLVKDTGPGIPAECVDHIFEPFFTTKTRGTGLGLSIALQIVEAHEGEIRVSTRPGRGATFTVRIPVERNGTRANGGSEYGARG